MDFVGGRYVAAEWLKQGELRQARAVAASAAVVTTSTPARSES